MNLLQRLQMLKYFNPVVYCVLNQFLHRKWCLQCVYYFIDDSFRHFAAHRTTNAPTHSLVTLIFVFVRRQDRGERDKLQKHTQEQCLLFSSLTDPVLSTDSINNTNKYFSNDARQWLAQYSFSSSRKQFCFC